MPTPPNITLLPGQPQSIGVIVTMNSVQTDGSNPGAPDLTTPLTFESVQNAAGDGAAVIPSVDPINNRRVVMTPAALAVDAPPMPWSFRVLAAGRSGFLTVTGRTTSPSDVSGVAWDGVDPTSP